MTTGINYEMSNVWQAFDPVRQSCRADLLRQIDRVIRDYGPYGRHRDNCVYLRDETSSRLHWCCATDCPLKGRS